VVSGQPCPGGDGTTNLTASPNGTPHTFVWNAQADLVKSDNVVYRIRAQPGYSHGPILWPALDGKSFSFRVTAPWYIVEVPRVDYEKLESDPWQDFTLKV
jgi:hypothetical protein